MKLLLCQQCSDIFNLRLGHEKSCRCGQTKGRYVDELNAVYLGEYAVPLFFVNRELVTALRLRPDGPGPGKEFTAGVVPYECPTFKKEVQSWDEK